MLSVVGADLPTYDPTFKLTSGQFSQLPEANEGQSLPVCFNGAEARSILLNRTFESDSSGSNYERFDFGIASTLHLPSNKNFTYSTSTPRPMFTDYRGDWGDVTSGNISGPGPTTTSFFSVATWGSSFPAAIGLSEELLEMGFSFANIDSLLNVQENNKILTHVAFRVTANLNGAGPAFDPGQHKWIVKVYQMLPGGIVGPVVAQAEVLKADYADHFTIPNNLVYKTITATLDKPVVMTRSGDFFIGISQTFETIAADAPYETQRTITLVQSRLIGTASAYYRQVFAMNKRQGEVWAAFDDSVVQIVPSLSFIGAAFDLENVAPVSPLVGIAPGYLQLKIYSYQAPESSAPDMSQIAPPVFSLTALDGNNYLGNGFSAPVTLAPDIIKIFDSTVDVSTFAPKTNSAAIRARLDAGSVRQFLMEVLRSAACKLIPLSTGVLACWPYRTNASPSLMITEDDCILSGFSLSGQDELINSAKIFFDRREERGGFLAYREFKDVGSIAKFGEKQLEDGEFGFSLSEGSNITRIITELFTRFSAPLMRVSISVPFWRSDFRALKLMDWISINHVDVPSIGGSRISDSENPITTNGIDLGIDINLGASLRKAKTITCQIVGLVPNWQNDEASLEMTLEVRRNGNW